MKNEEWGKRILGNTKNNEWLTVGALFLLALIARLLFLGSRPFDGDEGVIIKMAQSANLTALFSAVSKDVHPPLYHLLEFASLKILPFNEFNARLLSALFGTLTIVAVYFVFRKIFTYIYNRS